MNRSSIHTLVVRQFGTRQFGTNIVKTTDNLAFGNSKKGFNELVKCIRCFRTDVVFQSYFTRGEVLILTLSDEVRGKPDMVLITDRPLGNS